MGKWTSWAELHIRREVDAIYKESDDRYCIAYRNPYLDGSWQVIPSVDGCLIPASEVMSRLEVVQTNPVYCNEYKVDVMAHFVGNETEEDESD